MNGRCFGFPNSRSLENAENLETPRCPSVSKATRNFGTIDDTFLTKWLEEAQERTASGRYHRTPWRVYASTRRTFQLLDAYGIHGEGTKSRGTGISWPSIQFDRPFFVRWSDRVTNLEIQETPVVVQLLGVKKAMEGSARVAKKRTGQRQGATTEEQ